MGSARGGLEAPLGCADCPEKGHRALILLLIFLNLRVNIALPVAFDFGGITFVFGKGIFNSFLFVCFTSKPFVLVCFPLL